MTVDFAPPTRTMPPVKKHASFSQLDELLRCGKAFQLHRVLGLTASYGLPRAGGSAVHAATEAHDRRLFTALGK